VLLNYRYWGDEVKKKKMAVGVGVGKQNSLGRPRCRWDNNIKRHRKGIEWEGVDYIYVIHGKAK